MSKQFQRTTENFVCERCGSAVEGTGYTNHCPQCFTSKHVDVNPGDRAAACGGLMKVIDIEQFKKGWKIVHECEECQFTRKQTVGSEDNMDNLIALQTQITKRKFNEL